MPELLKILNSGICLQLGYMPLSRTLRSSGIISISEGPSTPMQRMAPQKHSYVSLYRNRAFLVFGYFGRLGHEEMQNMPRLLGGVLAVLTKIQTLRSM